VRSNRIYKAAVGKFGCRRGHSCGANAAAMSTGRKKGAAVAGGSR
jgi:hypothetical protein